MDVDADGSDSDRLPAGTGAPTNFKPATSYRWEKKTDTPNPYLAATEQRLKRAEDEYALASTAPARKRELRNAIAELRAEVSTLKKFSFLIGATDPFIVVPGTFTRGPDPVKVGDYALVLFGDAIYPVIVGDVGPNDKVGEASLRIAKELNALSTAYNRPVSDLKVSYIIFPGTAEKPFGPPDLDKIHARCETLVKEIGGASVPLSLQLPPGGGHQVRFLNVQQLPGTAARDDLVLGHGGRAVQGAVRRVHAATNDDEAARTNGRTNSPINCGCTYATMSKAITRAANAIGIPRSRERMGTPNEPVQTRLGKIAWRRWALP